MAEVVWSDRALPDIAAITAYISQFRPMAAQAFGLRLIEAGNALAAASDRGRLIPGNRRELSIVPPYLIRYRVRGERVTVLEIRHGARRRR